MNVDVYALGDTDADTGDSSPPVRQASVVLSSRAGSSRTATRLTPFAQTGAAWRHIRGMELSMDPRHCSLLSVRLLCDLVGVKGVHGHSGAHRIGQGRLKDCNACFGGWLMAALYECPGGSIALMFAMIRRVEY